MGAVPSSLNNPNGVPSVSGTKNTVDNPNTITNKFHQTTHIPIAMDNTSTTPNPSFVIRVSSFDQWRYLFSATKDSNKMMVVYFTATWCRPCRIMDAFVRDNLYSKFKDVFFVQVDVDELMGVASGFGVQTLPTFVLLKRGVVVDKVVGVRKEELKQKLEIHYGDLQRGGD